MLAVQNTISIKLGTAFKQRGRTARMGVLLVIVMLVATKSTIMTLGTLTSHRPDPFSLVRPQGHVLDK